MRVRKYNIVDDLFGSKENREFWENELKQQKFSKIDWFYKNYTKNIKEYDIFHNELEKLAVKNNVSNEDECKELIKVIFKNRNKDLTNNKVGYITERDLEVIKEIYWNNKNIKQVASEMGISSERVRQLLARALHRFRIGFRKYFKIF